MFLYYFFLKMAKKTLTGPGLDPETSGLTYRRSYHLSYPALRWCPSHHCVDGDSSQRHSTVNSRVHLEPCAWLQQLEETIRSLWTMQFFSNSIQSTDNETFCKQFWTKWKKDIERKKNGMGKSWLYRHLSTRPLVLRTSTLTWTIKPLHGGFPKSLLAFV